LFYTGPVKLYNLGYLSMLSIIKDMLQPFAGKKILDAGCGDGRFCYEMSRENVDILGIDYSERAVRFARAFNPSVEILCGDLSQMSFLEEFDIIVIVEVIEHIPPKNIASVLKSLSKALKHDGRLLVSVPTSNDQTAKKHYQHFTQESLEQLLRKFFTLEKIVGNSRGG